MPAGHSSTVASSEVGLAAWSLRSTSTAPHAVATSAASSTSNST